MSSWKSANLAGLIPSSLTDITDQLSTVVSATATVLGVISSALNVAKNFLLAFPAFNFLGLLSVLIQNFKDDFLDIGMYSCNMWDYPLHQYYRTGIRGETFTNSFYADLVASFSDPYDANKPQYTGATAALVLVTTAPGLGPIQSILELAKDAFAGFTELQRILDAIEVASQKEAIASVAEQVQNGTLKFSNSIPATNSKWLKRLKRIKQSLDVIDADYLKTVTVPTTIDGLKTFIPTMEALRSNAEYPTWNSITLRKVIPQLEDIANDVFDPILSALETGQDILDTILQLIDIIDQKVTVLQNIATNLATYISALDALISLTGFYALWVTTTDGISGIETEIKNATSQPFGESELFFSGITFVSGGPDYTKFVNLFSPLG